jgi:hypothetical protein
VGRSADNVHTEFPQIHIRACTLVLDLEGDCDSAIVARLTANSATITVAVARLQAARSAHREAIILLLNPYLTFIWAEGFALPGSIFVTVISRRTVILTYSIIAGQAIDTITDRTRFVAVRTAYRLTRVRVAFGHTLVTGILAVRITHLTGIVEATNVNAFSLSIAFFCWVRITTIITAVAFIADIPAQGRVALRHRPDALTILTRLATVAVRHTNIAL